MAGGWNPRGEFPNESKSDLHGETQMATTAIVSYDDTLNDHDALMLGRVLAEAGASLTLTYVRHTTQIQPDREQLEEHEAEALLTRGARWLGDLNVDRRVVVSASTRGGLEGPGGA